MTRLARFWTLGLAAAAVVLGGWLWNRGLPEAWLSTETRSLRELRRELAASLPAWREAEIRVLEILPGTDGGPPVTRLEWRELDAESQPGAPIHFSVAGIQPRFEALTLTFASGDGDRDPLAGKTLVLFRRAYGEHTAPDQGF
ncbi:MAG: hypothetical protein KDB53_19915, partial [Planctomycetes bacterium]|nr:hypothetical protein [Planctomycetota bacterium]